MHTPKQIWELAARRAQAQSPAGAKNSPLTRPAPSPAAQQPPADAKQAPRAANLHTGHANYSAIMRSHDRVRTRHT